MANTPFQSLSAQDRRDALEVAASLSGRRAHLLEKDIWVVQTLSVLFDAPFGRDLVFKGGTSLAKAYHAIRRFSEDIDITYDIRALRSRPSGQCRRGGAPGYTQPGTTLDAGDPDTAGEMGARTSTAGYSRGPGTGRLLRSALC